MLNSKKRKNLSLLLIFLEDLSSFIFIVSIPIFPMSDSQVKTNAALTFSCLIVLYQYQYSHKTLFQSHSFNTVKHFGIVKDSYFDCHLLNFTSS